MDLMTLAAKIQLDDSEFTKGVSKAESTGKQLAGKMGAMTVAMGNLAAQALQKGIEAITGVVSGAIDGYADYQQLIGGVETLFKSSADKVANYAKQSYKTTGLSANQYMETVTGFSASLLQGLGGDTEKAATLANQAVTDMADNANKMGTDIKSIQTAYQGFAKQNYTMLDNLKLGYGGTREEMIRLINDSGILDEEISSLDGISFDQIIEAIHRVQTEMGITGTTAKEAAETISGSKASLKAAWEDMLAAMGGAGGQENFDKSMEHFKTSFSTYLENFVPTLVTTITNSGGLVGAVADAIAQIPTDLMANIGLEAMESGAEIVTGVGKVANWLLESLINTFKSLTIDNTSAVNLGEAIGSFIGTALNTIVTNSGAIFDGILALGQGLASGFVDGLFGGLFGEDAEVDKIAKEMTQSFTDAEYKATKSGALLAYMKSLVDQYGEAATETQAWKSAVDEMKTILPESESIFTSYSESVNLVITSLDQMIEKLHEAALAAALEKALMDAYQLQADQQIEYNREKQRKVRNEDMAKTIDEEVLNTIQEAAKNRLAEFDKEVNGREMTPEEAQYRSEIEKVSRGESPYAYQEGAKLSDYGYTELKYIADAYGLQTYTDEELKGKQKAHDEAVAEAADATAKMEAAAKELDATKSFIADTQAAVKDTALEMGSTVPEQIESGGLAVQGSLEGVAAKLAAWNPPQFQGTYMPEATGIDYVPYNGFKAELHRGETILTKAEADRYRNGAGTAEVVGAIQSLNNNIQNMQLVVGRKSFGRAVVGYGGTGMNDYIGRAESRRSSGYGT